MRTVFLKLTSFHALLVLNRSVALHRARSKGLQSSLFWLSQQTPAVLVPALSPFSCTCLCTHLPIRIHFHFLIPCTPEPHHLPHPRLTTSIVVLLKSNSSKSLELCHLIEPFVVVVKSLSHAGLFATPWTAAHQASLSFSISWSYSNS